MGIASYQGAGEMEKNMILWEQAAYDDELLGWLVHRLTPSPLSFVQSTNA